MIPVPVIAFPIAILIWLLTLGGSGLWMYEHGKFIQKAEYTDQQLTQANANLKSSEAQAKTASAAGADHETKVQVVHDTTRTIVQTVQIPADADPFLPVGFVRLFDRSASRDISADPYPGKSDGDPSDVRVSEAATLLAKDWANNYYTCQRQISDIVALHPVLPPAPEAEHSLIERLNPFH